MRAFRKRSGRSVGVRRGVSIVEVAMADCRARSNQRLNTERP